ncbi:hypothetical protein ACO1O0_005897 [Amphichorda felina]
MYGKIATAALSLAALAAAAPTSQPKKLAARGAVDSYTFFTGNGSPEAGWPAKENWPSYEELWEAASPLMMQSCSWNSWGENNSQQETDDIKRAIEQVSGETGVDNRFILSIIMQESKGCVRAPTTDNGVINPGLMQSHNGSGMCAGVNPCPYETIVLMIQDGTAGTADGDGIKQTLESAVGEVGDSARAYYGAARKYNSGSVDFNDLNNGFTSTACYATDVANRFMGWTMAASACPL